MRFSEIIASIRAFDDLAPDPEPRPKPKIDNDEDRIHGGGYGGGSSSLAVRTALFGAIGGGL